MPELPEVQTTVDGINKLAKGHAIRDVWTSYKSLYHAGKNNIKNPEYFSRFKKDVIGAKILSAKRRGKNVLIHLSNGNTILTHMKMTGHYLFGDEKLEKNKYIRLVFYLSNSKVLAFSDLRKFAKVYVYKTKEEKDILDLMELGPEPLEKSFTFKIFKEQILKRKNWGIKQALLDQKIIAGVGNIYSDEILWASGVHPLSKVSLVPEKYLKEIYKNTKLLLQKGIKFGGDSMSDYRNIYGERGNFQNKHNVYRKTGEKCSKKISNKKCVGIISKIKVGGRSGHFCPVHQKLFA